MRTDEYLESGEYGLITGTDFNNGLVDWKTCSFVSEWRYLERWNADRRLCADRYRLLFESRGLTDRVTLPEELAGNHHIYHQYVVRVPDRDRLMAHLDGLGLTTRVYYPLPLHLQPCFAFLGGRPGDCPQAERLSQESLALPIFPGLEAEEQERLVEAIAAFPA